MRATGEDSADHRVQLDQPAPAAAAPVGTRPVAPSRANDLDGRTWQRYSISVWSDIKKTLEEHRLRHPALFPMELVLRLIQCFSSHQDRVVLDPFAGAGSTPLAAQLAGRHGIGIELSPEYTAKARTRRIYIEEERGAGGVPTGRRFGAIPLPLEPGTCDLYTGDARNLLDYVAPSSVDLVITSPPYWDVLLRDRSANRNRNKHYGREEPDLGKITGYGDFLAALREVFSAVYEAMRPGKFCIVVVMDVRKRDRLYSLHMDVAALMQSIGFEYDDLLIWDRRHEYNHMRPLGYPYRFRVNKAHEFMLIFRKPQR